MIKVPIENQKQILEDLLREKRLRQVYFESRKIPFSKVNIFAGLFVSLLAWIGTLWTSSSGAIADSLLLLATSAFAICLAQLGFLLAGFSFFATVADKKLFVAMACKTHKDSGLSYLKYNFLAFMRVFCEYLVFTGICLLMIIGLDKSAGFRTMISVWLGDNSQIKFLFASLTWALFCGTLFYLILQLSSFIFNIYHVVMTCIKWELIEAIRIANETDNDSRPANDLEQSVSSPSKKTNDE